MPRPVYVIGIDACDAVLVDRWVKEGLLPEFTRLRGTAASMSVRGSHEAMQGSVWPTFFTAHGPAEHGMYYMLQMRNREQRLRRVRARDLRKPPFWGRLTDTGTCVTVDVPKLGRVNGQTAQVIEWGAMDHYSRFAAYPKGLEKRIRSDYGEHALTRGLDEAVSPSKLRTLYEGLLEGIVTKSMLNQDLIESYDPNLFISVFAETHAAGHYFWRFHENPLHPDNPLPGGDPLLSVYRAMDAALGVLTKRYESAANIFVLSGHGMMPDGYPRWILSDVLERGGFLRLRESVRSEDTIRREQTLGTAVLRSELAHRSRRFRSMANRYFVPKPVQTRLWMRNLHKRIDFSRTRAWALPTDLQGFIRLNLRGREPKGTVRPEHYSDLIDEICAELINLKNAKTNEPIVNSIYKSRELWPDGTCLDLLPDIAVLWNNDCPDIVVSDSLGEFFVPWPHAARAGNHRPEGFCFASGPDIRSNLCKLKVDLLDLGPTILALLGRSSADLPGSPLPILTREPS